MPSCRFANDDQLGTTAATVLSGWTRGISGKLSLPICGGCGTRRASRKRTSPHEAGINRSYMSKLENGASYPGQEIIAKLATVLKVEPAEPKVVGLARQQNNVVRAIDLTGKRRLDRLPNLTFGKLDDQAALGKLDRSLGAHEKADIRPAL